MYFEKKAIVFATCFLDIFVNHAIFGTQILFLGTMGFHSLSTAYLFFPVILKSLLLALTLAYYSPLILLPMEALLIFFPGASIFICSWCEDVPGWWKSAKSPFLLPFFGAQHVFRECHTKCLLHQSCCVVAISILITYSSPIIPATNQGISLMS